MPPSRARTLIAGRGVTSANILASPADRRFTPQRTISDGPRSGLIGLEHRGCRGTRQEHLKARLDSKDVAHSTAPGSHRIAESDLPERVHIVARPRRNRPAQKSGRSTATNHDSLIPRQALNPSNDPPVTIPAADRYISPRAPRSNTSRRLPKGAMQHRIGDLHTPCSNALAIAACSWHPSIMQRPSATTEQGGRRGRPDEPPGSRIPAGATL